jgi:hypothetical protein
MRINGWLVVLIMNAITMISQNLMLRIKKKEEVLTFSMAFVLVRWAVMWEIQWAVSWESYRNSFNNIYIYIIVVTMLNIRK